MVLIQLLSLWAYKHQNIITTVHCLNVVVNWTLRKCLKLSTLLAVKKVYSFKIQFAIQLMTQIFKCQNQALYRS